ncbi:aldehyde dehydrogenase family protein [Streptomyces sp. NPDC015139]|uniref:aldehyde dehydrogenase family protein n=1 Tax=Streptomyces sp. NPDC015139 TaxID=3364942 RepID=UPI0036F70DAB
MSTVTRAAPVEVADADLAEPHGGEARVGDESFDYALTVVAGLRQDDEIVQSEIFGPVVTTQVFSTDEEAYAQADDNCHGLASSVFPLDRRRAMRA